MHVARNGNLLAREQNPSRRQDQVHRAEKTPINTKQPITNETESKMPKERKPKKPILTKKFFQKMRRHYEEVYSENERMD